LTTSRGHDQPDAYTEISGVRSHILTIGGRGYAGELTRLAVKRIIKRTEIPFLHVFATNTSAVELYEKPGFVLQREVILTNLALL
jgi:predicted GNAT family acetyltransferase